MNNSSAQRGIALFSLLLVMVIMLLLGVSIVGLTTSQARYSTKRSNEMIARQAAEAGISEVASLLNRDSNWDPQNLRNRLETLLCVLPGDIILTLSPPCITYTKSTGANNCYYQVTMDVDIGSRTVNATSMGYIAGPGGKNDRQWGKSVKTTFTVQDSRYTLCALDSAGPDSMKITGNSKITGDLATYQEGSTTEINNPDPNPQIQLYVKNGSTLKVLPEPPDPNKPQPVLVTAMNLPPPLLEKIPPFPSSQATADFDFQSGTTHDISSTVINTLKVGAMGTRVNLPGGDCRINRIEASGTEIHNALKTTIVFKPGTYQIGTFDADNTEFLIDNPPPLPGAPGAPSPSSQGVKIFVYQKLDINRCLVNRDGMAKDLFIGTWPSIEDVKFNNTEGKLVLQHKGLKTPRVNLDINNCILTGAFISRSMLINNTEIKMDSSVSGGSGPVQMTSWQEN